MKTIFPQIISNTDLSLWSDCELKWFRSRCQCLRKKSFNINLTAGGAFAKGIELSRKAYYNDQTTEQEAIDIGFNYVLDNLHEQEFQDDLKSPARMSLALKQYFQQFPLDNDLTPPIKLSSGEYAIENTIVIKLPIQHPILDVPLVFKVKLDMLCNYMGRTYIVDEKTCKIINKKEASLLATAGQFCGYAWGCRELGVKVQGALIRKVAIQKAGNRLEQIEIPITEFMIDAWYVSMLDKVRTMVNKYRHFLNGSNFSQVYVRDFQSGCTAYFSPCAFQEGCSSKYGESFIETEFQQITWDAEKREEIDLDHYIELLKQ